MQALQTVLFIILYVLLLGINVGAQSVVPQPLRTISISGRSSSTRSQTDSDLAPQFVDRYD